MIKENFDELDSRAEENDENIGFKKVFLGRQSVNQLYQFLVQ